MLAPGSPRSAVFDELEMRVRKTTLEGSTPLRGILTYLEESPADLIVLATAGRQGMPRWLRSSVAEPIARESRTLSLFVPTGARGFVDLETGRLSLRRVLLPVDHEPAPQEALIYCTRAAAMLGEGDVEITLLHVGEEAPPELSLPEGAAWTFRRESRRGDPIDEIIAAAHETGADLVCMATAGRQGVLDALRGSTTEQVLRRVSCPLLAVPSL